MSEQDRLTYAFDNFVLDAGERLLLRDGEPIPLPPKAFDLLIVLVSGQGRLLRKDDLLKVVWDDAAVEEGNISWNIHLVRKALGDNSARPRYVKTVSKQGYRFIAPVQEVRAVGSAPEASGTPDAEEPFVEQPEVTEGGVAEGVGEAAARGAAGDTVLLPQVLPRQLPLPVTSRNFPMAVFGGHLCHVLVSCALYALLYSVALLVEVAYRFDELGPEALRIAPAVFFWIFLTSLAGLAADWTRTLKGEAKGLALSLFTFTGAAVLLYAGLGNFLPGVPVTEAKFQTYTAHGAYLKSLYYFLPLAVLFLILPFHFVVSAQRELQAGCARSVLATLLGEGMGVMPKGGIYLRVRWLAVTLTTAALVSVAVLAHLFENLLPNEHLNLFMQSVQWRTLLYFGLGLECLVWYYRSLWRIKHTCLESCT